MVIRYICTAILAYLLGSVSTGIVFAKLTGKPDPRTAGSKSTGATNSLRTMGKAAGLVVLLGDALKAVLACIIGMLLVDTVNPGLPPYGKMLASVFVVVGHIWPCWFGFKGGKGVACIIACGIMCYPMPGLVALALGLGALAVTRMVSIGSIVGVGMYAVVSLFWYGHGNLWVVGFAWVLAVMCIGKHHTNISRIIHGKENKFSLKSAGKNNK